MLPFVHLRLVKRSNLRNLIQSYFLSITDQISPVEGHELKVFYLDDFAVFLTESVSPANPAALAYILSGFWYRHF